MKKFLLTPKEAAERYSVSESTLYEWARTGKIPCIRLSKRCLRFSISSLDQYFAEKETGVPLRVDV